MNRTLALSCQNKIGALMFGVSLSRKCLAEVFANHTRLVVGVFNAAHLAHHNTDPTAKRRPGDFLGLSITVNTTKHQYLSLSRSLQLVSSAPKASLMQGSSTNNIQNYPKGPTFLSRVIE